MEDGGSVDCAIPGIPPSHWCHDPNLSMTMNDNGVLVCYKWYMLLGEWDCESWLRQTTEIKFPIHDYHSKY